MPEPAKTDSEAFERVCRRLQDDVGRLILASRSMAQAHNTAPFWALARMLFPTAESIGDLVRQSAATSDNLLAGIEALEDVRPGYKDKAAILALLYRHSLMHTDDMRILRSSGKVIEWELGFDEHAVHLNVIKLDADRAKISFDLTSFYEDLLALCKVCAQRSFNGEAALRYNSWTTLDLDAKPKPTRTEKRARQEIAKLLTP